MFLFQNIIQSLLQVLFNHLLPLVNASAIRFIYLNVFQTNFFCLYPLERSENLWFPNLFRGNRKGSLAWKGLRNIICFTINPLRSDANRGSCMLKQTCSIHGLFLSPWDFFATRIKAALGDLCKNWFKYQKSTCCVSYWPMQVVYKSLLSSF